MVNERFLTSSIKRGVKMLTLATILAFVLAPPAMSQGIPVINEETTDYTHLLLNISGSNFGTKVGTVTLGGSSLTVVSWSASKIVANLPATTVPGTYLLVVTTKPLGLIAVADVTLGAVGPQGVVGPQGPAGPA